MTDKENPNLCYLVQIHNIHPTPKNFLLLQFVYLFQLVGLLEALDDSRQSFLKSKSFFQSSVGKSVVMSMINPGTFNHQEEARLKINKTGLQPVSKPVEQPLLDFQNCRNKCKKVCSKIHLKLCKKCAK